MLKIKHLGILIPFILSSMFCKAQISAWNWSSAPINYNETATLINLTASALSVSSGSISYVTSPGAVSVSSWSTSASFLNTGKYWQLSVTPSSNFQTAITSFTFDAGRTASGPQTITVQYSLDGFTTAGITLLSGANNTSTGILSSFAANTNLPVAATTNTITFRIWGYGASSTGNFRLNNISINGTTASTNTISNYYLKTTGVCNLTSSWTSDSTLAGGNSPGNFSAINQNFYLRNQTSSTINAAWDVTGTGSKIILGDSNHVTTFTIPSGFPMSCINGVDIMANSVLIIANNTVPVFATISALSTVNYGGISGSQNITQTNYGNLILSGGGIRVFPSGIVGISGTFDPGSFIASNAGTILLNGLDGQLVPSFSYNHLSSLNYTRVLANGVIGIQGVFSPGTNNYTLGTSTINFSGSVLQNIPLLQTGAGPRYYNLSYSGTNKAILADSITVLNDVTVSSGVLALTHTTKKLLTIGGNLIINGGTVDFASNGATAGGEIDLSGNLIQTTLFGTLTTANTGNGNINFKGNKTISSPQTISLFTTNSLNYTNLTINKGSTVRLLSDLLLRRETTANQSYQGTLTVNGILDVGTYSFNGGINNLSTNTFANFFLNRHATLITSNIAGIQSSIGINNLNRTFQDSTNYIFNGSTYLPFPTSAQLPVFGAVESVIFNASSSINRALTVTGQITLAAGIILTLDSFPISLGTVSGTGNFSVNNNSSITITGRPAMTPTYGDNIIYFDPLQHTIGSLNIGNGGIPATVTIGSSINIKANGTLSFGTGGGSTLFTSGNITLKSDSTSSATMANTYSSTITGNINIERYISGNNRRYRFLGFPFVSGVSLIDYRDDIWVTGPGTGGGSLASLNYNSNGFHYTMANDTSIFSFNEGRNNAGCNTRWEGISLCNAPLTSGKGYRFFYRGPLAQGTVCIDGSKPIPAEAIISASGSVKTGLQNFIIGCSNGCSNVAGNAAFNIDDGWNFIANPYPSAIDWNAITGWNKSRIKQTIWIWNPTNGSYGNWDGLTQTNGVNGIIASGQAFFVRADSVISSLSCTEAVKVNSTPSNLFKSAGTDLLNIKLIYDQYNNDECVVRFLDIKKDEFDANEDVLKMTNGNINIYTLPTPGVRISVNYLNTFNADKMYKIKIGITGAKTNYRLQFIGSKTFENATIYLHDYYLNTVTEIYESLQYPFEINVDGLSKGEERFEIAFIKNTSSLEEKGINKNSLAFVTPNPFNDHIIINDYNNTTIKYQLFDQLGEQLLQGTLNIHNTLISTEISTEGIIPGLYILKLYDLSGRIQINKMIKL